MPVRQAKAPRTRRALERSLTRLRVFVLTSALLLAAGALVLGTVLTQALHGQALDDAKLGLTQYANGVLTRDLVRDGRIDVDAEARDLVASDVAARPDIVSIKVWRRDGVLAWTNVAPERIGKRFPVTDHLREALETGEAEAELEHLDDMEDAAESRLGVDHVLEVYAPLVPRRGEPIGAYEIYADSAELESFLAQRKRVLWAATAAVFACLWLLLALLVREASRTLQRQTATLRRRSTDLMESYRRLEESSLEAIETLNAAVDAKDPYTAGHSQRVEAIAVAVGRELGLPPDRLDVLRLAALFHDIGKLAVPDAILLKPAPLTADEYAVIKRHAADGADIVAKLGRLRETVPLIRHHHERWDGAGYPDGLAADEIPLEACVVGLADAWDAMTTDRPYHRALTTDEAAHELRQGRGSQFAPAVVDAFFRALRHGVGERPLPRALAG
jgi:putative nucleotidyltransferase with HDIG domain